MRTLTLMLLVALFSLLAPHAALAAPEDEVGSAFRANAQAVVGDSDVTLEARVPGSAGSGSAGRGSSPADAARREAARREAARIAACRAENDRRRLTPEVEPLVLCEVVFDGAAPVVDVDPEVAARAALARLPIPAPVARIGPDPNINEWKMAAVGYPLWLWVEGPDEHRVTVEEQGITLVMVARRLSTGFELGDGSVIWCAYTPAWYFEVDPGTPSPGCGYVYQEPSLPKGTYPVIRVRAS